MATTPETFTLVLDGRGVAAHRVGGKAAALDQLIGLDLPVPRCGVVTTDAYRSFVEHAGLIEPLDRLRSAPPSADLAAERLAVDRLFEDAPMPDALADAIRDAALGVADGAPVAVRSSATAEDLGSASFAGQYRTSLDVAPSDVVGAVRLCWASLWHPEPRGYRRFRGLDETDLAMAALLMPMLAPTRAGVVFTEDPADPASMRIEMVHGLGDSLVSGARTPDVVTIDRSEVADFDGTPPELGELARLALRIERAFGTPMDIEWAIEESAVMLLQARPITTRHDPSAVPDDDGFDVAAGDARYTTAGIAEMLPGVLPPRIWDANGWLVEEGFRGLFDDLGAHAPGLEQAHALIGRVRGRAAINLDLMERVVESVPGGSAAELEHQYFGDILDPSAAPTTAPVDGSLLAQGIRTLRARTRAYQESEVVIQAIDRVLDDEPAMSTLDDRSALALRARLMHLACRTMETEIGVAATASASYRGLELFLRSHLDVEDATATVQRLTAADRATHRGRWALDLGELADRLAREPELSRVRTIESWPAAEAELDSSPAGRCFLAALSRTARRAGSTSVFGGPTWADSPELVWPMLRTIRSTDPYPDAVRAGAVDEIEGRLDPHRRFTPIGRFVDVRRRFLRREASDAAAFLQRREQTKASLLILGGVVWRLDRDLGRRLVASGHLDDICDVDFLTGRELVDAFAGQPPGADVIESRRRQLESARLAPPLERVFRGRPGPGAPRSIVGNSLTGWPGSPGRYEGAARIVEDTRRSALRRGEILVARTTDASWLPLFHIAGAVVVEYGGPLSHAAILARELGMPAVLNVPGIIDRVRDRPDSLLIVDGTAGTVGVHTPDASATQGGPPSYVADPADGVAPASRLTPVDGADPNRLGVFITGLIGAGALMSVAIGLTQAIGSARTQQRFSQRARLRAEALATGTIHGFEPAAVGPAGLRPRGYYAWTATVALMLGVLALWIGDDYVEEPSSATAFWLMALGLTSATTLGVVAVVALVAAFRWPVVSAAARRLSIPRVHERRTPAQLIGRVHASVVAALLLAVFVVAWLIAEAQGQLLAVDKWIFEQVGAGTRDNWWYPELLEDVLRAEVTVPPLGTTTMIVPLAIVLTFATYRCRPLMFTYPLVIAGSGMLHLTLQHFVQRDRPELGLKPGYDDSFPGGHANELTLVLGLLPLVLYVLTRRNWIRPALEIVCAVTLIVALADSVRVGDHWPTDNLSGFLIGSAMVLIARGVARSPGLHARCNRCPAQLRAADEAGRT